MIAQVVASERARAQTAGVTAPRGVVGPTQKIQDRQQNPLESGAGERDSRVSEV